MRTLQTPLSEEDVRSLKLGETVYLSGPIVTGRDEMHIRALEYSEQGRDVPDCLQGSVIFHCGPIMRQRDDGTWAVVAAGPTTSARMNKLEPEMIPTFNIRAIGTTAASTWRPRAVPPSRWPRASTGASDASGRTWGWPRPCGGSRRRGSGPS